MNLGRVHVWQRDRELPLGGRVVTRVVPLRNLDPDRGALSGKYVRVRNAGWLNEPRSDGAGVEPAPLGDARPDGRGDFLFEPSRGGPRVDKYTLRSAKYRRRYVEASRFGEVNTYYHIDRIASYVDELLHEIGERSLPPVIAVVNAHAAAVVRDGVRDGEWRKVRWMPFEGGHYRLPSRPSNLREFDPVAPTGEIHLGPGWHLVDHGALADSAGARYRHNAAHNAGVIYHEYGHHVSRHTADFCANAQRPPDRQSNIKTALDEGYCDYFAATMLDLPHIWVWHRSHLVEAPHARNLTSAKTASDYDDARGADPHANGTIWAAALWDLRTRLATIAPDGERCADKLVLQSLLGLGRLTGNPSSTRGQVRRARATFSAALAALLRADQRLNGEAFRAEIVATFARRGVEPDTRGALRSARTHGPRTVVSREGQGADDHVPEIPPGSPLLRTVRRHVAIEEIPESVDLLSGSALESQLGALHEPSLSMIAVGDVMLGARAGPVIAERGTDHLFSAVAPLLRRAPVVLGNLEGPLAKRAAKQPRHHSYRVRPDLAAALVRAGFKVMTLANNHLLDCGRAGVIETLEALASVDIAVVGAGADRSAAHRPAILQQGSVRIGVLGYYWNRRTSATHKLPGSAMDPPEALQADIAALREHVDRVVVTFHWGIPYEREPLTMDRDKARLAVDLGADVVIGHHTHVVQPFEVYRDRPIFYSVGNFTFGSANSMAEGLVVGIRFEPRRTRVEVYPLYVKNRDPRVAYQPKVMRGSAAMRCLSRLAERSGPNGALLAADSFRGVIDLPWAPSRLSTSSARSG